MAEAFVSDVSDEITLGAEQLESPPGEKTDINYAVNALDIGLRAIAGGILGTELGTINAVGAGADTLVDGLVDGLESGDVVGAITGSLGQFGNTLAYEQPQTFLNIFGGIVNGNVKITFTLIQNVFVRILMVFVFSGEGTVPQLRKLENGENPIEDLQNFENGVSLFLREVLGENVGGLSAFIASELGAVKEDITGTIDILGNVLNGEYSDDLIGGITTDLIDRLGKGFKNLYEAGGQAFLTGVESVVI